MWVVSLRYRVGRDSEEQRVTKAIMTSVDIDVLCSSVTSSWHTREGRRRSTSTLLLLLTHFCNRYLYFWLVSYTCLGIFFFFLFLFKRPSLFLLHVISKMQAKKGSISP
jgi:hypothetical protein